MDSLGPVNAVLGLSWHLLMRSGDTVEERVVPKSSYLIATIFLLALGQSKAAAVTSNGVLTVQATVVASCTVASGTLAFGVIDPAVGTSTLPSVNLNVTCTQGTSFSVGLGEGANASGTQRRMKGSNQSQFLSYDLFRDNVGTQRFGDSVVTQRLTGQTGLGSLPNTIPIYGSIAGGQNAPADTYSDTVPITVYY